jgi:hypothetical protein
VAGTDADRRDGELAAGGRRQRLGDGFEDDQAGTGFLLGEGVGEQPRGAGIIPALDPVATELMHRLRCQADVSADRNAARTQKARRLGHVHAAFELDHLGAGGHQGDRVAQRPLRALLEAAEGHVGDHQRSPAAARDAGGVVGDVGERHRQCRFMALQDHAERVADEQGVDAGAIAQLRKACVVTREHGDLVAAGAHPGKVPLRQAACRNVAGHELTLPG